MSATIGKYRTISETWRHYLRRGVEHLDGDRISEAVPVLRQALHGAPEEPTVLFALGRALAKDGQLDESEQHLRHALRVKPSSPATRAALARLVGLDGGRADEGLELVERGLRRLPRAGGLQVVRGELLLELGRVEEAGEAFGLGRHDPVSRDVATRGLARVVSARGLAKAEEGDIDGAVEALEKAAELDLEWSAPLVNLGVVYHGRGLTSRALECYARAVNRDPANPVAYFNLGATLRELGRNAEAVHALECLLELDSDYPGLRLELANVLGELGHFERAASLLLEQLDRDDSDPGCWSSLGLAYAGLGQKQRAERCLGRALELDPEHPNARHNLTALTRMECSPTGLEAGTGPSPSPAEDPAPDVDV